MGVLLRVVVIPVGGVAAAVAAYALVRGGLTEAMVGYFLGAATAGIALAGVAEWRQRRHKPPG